MVLKAAIAHRLAEAMRVRADLVVAAVLGMMSMAAAVAATPAAAVAIIAAAAVAAALTTAGQIKVQRLDTILAMAMSSSHLYRLKIIG